VVVVYEWCWFGGGRWGVLRGLGDDDGVEVEAEVG
jgi:hypothetical protein